MTCTRESCAKSAWTPSRPPGPPQPGPSPPRTLPSPAGLLSRDAAGRHYPLQPAATRIGRLADNDIVLDDAEVSRHHAVIVDTGSSFVITDLRSGNGVQVQHRRLHSSATFADGDDISICGYEFIFEIRP